MNCEEPIYSLYQAGLVDPIVYRFSPHRDLEKSDRDLEAPSDVLDTSGQDVSASPMRAPISLLDPYLTLHTGRQ